MLPGLVEFARLGRAAEFVNSGMGDRSRCRFAEPGSATAFPFPFPSLPPGVSSTSIRSSSSCAERLPPCKPFIVAIELAELGALFRPFAVRSSLPLSVVLLLRELMPLRTLILSSSSSISAFFRASKEYAELELVRVREPIVPVAEREDDGRLVEGECDGPAKSESRVGLFGFSEEMGGAGRDGEVRQAVMAGGECEARVAVPTAERDKRSVCDVSKVRRAGVLLPLSFPPYRSLSSSRTATTRLLPVLRNMPPTGPPPPA